MNLIIDIGNTKTKVACVHENTICNKIATSDCSVKFISNFIEKHQSIEKVIVASVQEKPVALLEFLKSKFDACYFLDAQLPIPIANHYQTKHTLGYDRLAACVGAWKRYPNFNVLVIDAGTAITFDMVSAEDGYIGGCISPGINMRFKSLNHFTKKLPLLSVEDTFTAIGVNTNMAIVGGVEKGVIYEVDGHISQLQQQFKNLKTVITGGDADFIAKNTIHQMEKEEHILLWGLNTILNYQ